MALGKKTGGKNYVRGQSGNPNGRPPLSREIKELKSVNSTTLIEKLNKLLGSELDQLTALESAARTSVLERMLVSLIKKAVINGDVRCAELILGKFLGIKPPVEIANCNMVYLKSEYLPYINEDGSFSFHAAIVDRLEKQKRAEQNGGSS